MQSERVIDGLPRAGATDAFLTYSRRDRDFVRWLHAELAARGKDVFVDWEDIPDWSPDYQSDLETAIRSAGAFVFVLSPDSIASRHCLFELDVAVAAGKRIRPVLFRAVPDEAVPPALTRPQWLDFSSADGEAVAKLVAALDVDPEWVQAHTRLVVRAQEWHRRNRDGNLLLRGSDLRAAEDWLGRQAGRDPAPTPLQNEFVLAGRRAATRRQRMALGGALAALAVALALAIFAWVQRSRAIHDASVGRSRELATRSLAANEQRTMLELAAEALDEHETPEAEDALRVALGRGGEVGRVVGLTGSGAHLVSGSEHAVFICPDGSIGRLAEGVTAACRADARGRRPVISFSDDGRHALESGEKTSRMVDTTTGAVLGTIPFGSDATYAAGGLVAPGGRRVLARTADGAQLWALPARPGPATRLWHRAGVGAIALSPDGRRFATSAGGRTVRVWDGLSGRPLAALHGLATAPESLAITNSGLVVADGRGKSGVGVWKAGRRKALWIPRATRVVASTDGRQVAVQYGSGRVEIRSVAHLTKTTRTLRPAGVILSFSPDGNQITVLGKDDVVGVWSTIFAQRLGGFPTSTPELPELSRNGRLLLTYGYDDVARLWRISATPLVASAPVQRPWVRARPMLVDRLTTDGDRVTTVIEYDGIVRVWNQPRNESTTLFVAGSGLNVELSPDGRFVAESRERSTRIWSTRSGKVVSTVPANVYPVEFSLDGRLLAGRRGQRAVGVWSTDDAHQVGVFQPASNADQFLLSPTNDRLAVWDSTSRRVTIFRLGSHKTVEVRLGTVAADSIYTDVAFSPNGKLLAISSGDTIRVLRADTAKLVRLISGHPPPAASRLGVNGPRFSPDGRVLMADGLDQTTRAWNVANGEPLFVIRNGVPKTLSPDGTVLAAYIGLRVAVWSAATGRLLLTIPLSDGAFAFSHGGTRIVTGNSKDGLLRVYDCDACGSLERLRALARERLGKD